MTITDVCTPDDVIKWKHFPRYWPFVRGVHRLPVNSPHKGHWRGTLMVSLICAWINGWVKNLEDGDLRRHRAHYDVTVMVWVYTDGRMHQSTVTSLWYVKTTWLCFQHQWGYRRCRHGGVQRWPGHVYGTSDRGGAMQWWHRRYLWLLLEVGFLDLQRVPDQSAVVRWPWRGGHLQLPTTSTMESYFHFCPT